MRLSIASGFSRPTTKSTVSFGKQVMLNDWGKDKGVDTFLQLWQNGQLPPFQAEFHAGRRQALLNMLPPNSTVILVGADEQPYTPQINLPFHQDSNFHYFTGLDEPNAIAIISNVGGKATYNLLVNPLTEHDKTWGAGHAGVEGAKTKYGVDQANTYTLKEDLIGTRTLKQKLNALTPKGTKNLSIVLPHVSSELSRRVNAAFSRKQQRDITAHIINLRMRKTPYEMALMKRASEATSAGFRIAREKLQSGETQWEYQAAADLTYGFQRNGATRNSFQTIPAAGANACGLHYRGPAGQVKRTDAMLLDAGGEVANMAADVTRVFPTNRFTFEHGAIYSLVLEAQKAGIEAVKVGATFEDVDQAVLKVYQQGLVELGIFTKDQATPENIKELFPHHTGHYLGMDCHDPCEHEGRLPNYTVKAESRGFRNMPLAEGMIITVEPGLYFSEGAYQALKQKGISLHPKWKGIGIRIEDNIAAVRDGYINFTQEARIPKELDEIQKKLIDRHF